MNIEIPYHKRTMSIDVPDHRLKSVLVPEEPVVQQYVDESRIVSDALAAPCGSERLSVMAKDRNRILLITSDHTRPVPSKITMPLLLEEIRAGNPDAEIRIIIATGFHRPTTTAELIDKFGETIVANEEIIIHDAFDDSRMTFKGLLPSGGELWINDLIDWADLIVAEGFIEPHFFAGFSGGRKSVLPGICSAKTIMYNHNSRFIADRNSRAGVLDGNPMHKDMLFAAKKAGLGFILNVTLDHAKRITAAFAGEPGAAHETGCALLSSRVRVDAVKADIVVTSNGGYPLDQNVYQTVKGMTAAEKCINPGGVMIVVSSCCDGHGGEGFLEWFTSSGSPKEVADKISSIKPEDTLPDQWEAQILARILMKCREVIIVSEHADPSLIRSMHMHHESSFEDALKYADKALGVERDIVVIPDGVSVIVD